MTEPVEGQVLDPHELLAEPLPGGTLVRLHCACLGWEAVVNGHRAASWAHAEHVAHTEQATSREEDHSPRG